jgi:ESCRT-II complex subunit VPS22
MRRRGAGIGAIQKDKKAAERYKDKGTALAETNFAEMTKQMETFRQNLEEFAREHREDIKKNSEFRKHFQVQFLTFIVITKPTLNTLQIVNNVNL